MANRVKAQVLRREHTYALARVSAHQARVFMHQKDFPNEDHWELLSVGDIVELEVTDSPRGPRGLNVRLVESEAA
jgi:hypothetical protein